jgi:hypothetical protein
LWASGYFAGRLLQTIAAQAILAIHWHRQAGDLLGTPARPGQAAGEFRSAAGTGEATRGKIFQPVGHGQDRNFAAFLTPLS